MSDAEVVRLAGAQFNRVSRAQLGSLGLSAGAIQHRLARGRLVIVEQGVLAFPPVLPHDDLFRSTTLEGNCTTLRGIALTTPERTVLDLAASVSDRTLARIVREAVRLRHTSLESLADVLGRYRGSPGSRRLSGVLARYSGPPLERARSGAEVRALEILRDADRALPRLNVRVAGEEADLSWPGVRLIVEIDGGPYHLDAGQDARKTACWERAGWTVCRISADAVYDDPDALLRLALPAAVSVARRSPPQ